MVLSIGFRSITYQKQKIGQNSEAKHIQGLQKLWLCRGLLSIVPNVGTMRCTAYVPTFQNSTDLSSVLRIVRVSVSCFITDY
jgi:hypothetical protein